MTVTRWAFSYLPSADAPSSRRGRNRGSDDGPEQAVYAGWHTPAEAVHDASLYRIFQVEAAAIEDHGTTTDGVVLNDELTREVYARTIRSRFSVRGRIPTSSSGSWATRRP
jgi:hypothetical protein